MQLLVDALKAVGPQVTRGRVKAAIDSMRFSSGLTLQSVLAWPPAPRRFAASTMQAFEIQYAGTFGGWRAQSIVTDPQPLLGTG